MAICQRQRSAFQLPYSGESALRALSLPFQAISDRGLPLFFLLAQVRDSMTTQLYSFPSLVSDDTAIRNAFYRENVQIHCFEIANQKQSQDSRALRPRPQPLLLPLLTQFATDFHLFPINRLLWVDLNLFNKRQKCS